MRPDSPNKLAAGVNKVLIHTHKTRAPAIYTDRPGEDVAFVLNSASECACVGEEGIFYVSRLSYNINVYDDFKYLKFRNEE